jgi:hypothetical protein
MRLPVTTGLFVEVRVTKEVNSVKRSPKTIYLKANEVAVSLFGLVGSPRNLKEHLSNRGAALGTGKGSLEILCPEAQPRKIVEPFTTSLRRNTNDGNNRSRLAKNRLGNPTTPRSKSTIAGHCLEQWRIP